MHAYTYMHENHTKIHTKTFSYIRKHTHAHTHIGTMADTYSCSGMQSMQPAVLQCCTYIHTTGNKPPHIEHIDRTHTHIHMYVCMCVCMYVQQYMYPYWHTDCTLCIPEHLYICICEYIRMHVQHYTYLWQQVHPPTHTYVHTYIHAYIHTHTFAQCRSRKTLFLRYFSWILGVLGNILGYQPTVALIPTGTWWVQWLGQNWLC